MPEKMSINTAELQSDLVEVCDTLNTLRAISANASERRSGGDKLTYSAAQVCDLAVLLLETICGKLNFCIDALDAIREPSPEPEPPISAKLKTLICNRDPEPDPCAADPDPEECDHNSDPEQ